MDGDNRLSAMVRAVRKAHPGDSSESRSSKRIVLAAMATRRNPCPKHWFHAIPLTVVLVGSAAMAVADGGRRASLVRFVAALFNDTVGQSSDARVITQRRVLMPVAEPTLSSPQEGESSSIPPVPVPVPVESAVPSVASSTIPAADINTGNKRLLRNVAALHQSPTASDAALLAVAQAHPVSTSPEVFADESSQDAPLYKAAHEAHFARKEAAAALVAWDAYLSQFPDGRFAIEARYNRAICLIRLGRHSDAESALIDFAAKHDSSYHGRDARRLLDLLRRP